MRSAPNQVFHHFEVWEDWRNGMYATLLREEQVDQSRELLADPGEFAVVLLDVAQAWPKATAHNLSNPYRNHQPWCGRAACSLSFGATITETNKAWFELTPQERINANLIADRFTYQWRQQFLPGQIAMDI